MTLREPTVSQHKKHTKLIIMSDKIGTTQKRLAWPLGKNDT